MMPPFIALRISQNILWSQQKNLNEFKFIYCNSLLKIFRKINGSSYNKFLGILLFQSLRRLLSFKRVKYIANTSIENDEDKNNHNGGFNRSLFYF